MKRNSFFSLFVTAGLLVTGCFGMADRADGPMCPICHENIVFVLAPENSNVAMTTALLFGCNHPDRFHVHCLVGLIQAQGASARCPLCRAPLLAHPQNLPAIVHAALSDQLAPVPRAAAPAPELDFDQLDELFSMLPLHDGIPVQASVPISAQQPVGPVTPAHVTDISQIIHYIGVTMAGEYTLNLSDSGLQAIDGHVFDQIVEQFPDLKRVNFAHTRLQVLPREVVRLQNVTGIYLSHTQLQKLPEEIGLMPELVFVDVRETPLVQTPGWPALCDRLRAQLAARNPGYFSYVLPS